MVLACHTRVQWSYHAGYNISWFVEHWKLLHTRISDLSHTLAYNAFSLPILTRILIVSPRTPGFYLGCSSNQPSIIMPTMQFARAGRSGAPLLDGDTAMPGAFSGNNVFLDPVIRADNMSVANVNFAPCARTNWHTHAGGQLLTVLAGSGWICGRGEEPIRLSVGDVVWCPPTGTARMMRATWFIRQSRLAVQNGMRWLEMKSMERKGRASRDQSTAPVMPREAQCYQTPYYRALYYQDIPIWLDRDLTSVDYVTATKNLIWLCWHRT